jgi:hypothetical protein
VNVYSVEGGVELEDGERGDVVWRGGRGRSDDEVEVGSVENLYGRSDDSGGESQSEVLAVDCAKTRSEQLGET